MQALWYMNIFKNTDGSIFSINYANLKMKKISREKLILLITHHYVCVINAIKYAATCLTLLDKSLWETRLIIILRVSLIRYIWNTQLPYRNLKIVLNLVSKFGIISS